MVLVTLSDITLGKHRENCQASDDIPVAGPIVDHAQTPDKP